MLGFTKKEKKAIKEAFDKGRDEVKKHTEDVNSKMFPCGREAAVEELDQKIEDAIYKEQPFQHFHTRSTQRRTEVAEFLTEMRDKYKLIHWEFEVLGGGQYFVVAEVDEKYMLTNDKGQTPKK